MDPVSEKLSIKNLLFTKAIPNYEIPVPIDGYKVYACTDCGDKFVFASSLEDHLNRKSVLITYLCRPCSQTIIFYNRCKLLFHIRSHSFKTATINVQDLKVEPIPLSQYKTQIAEVNKKKSQIIDSPKATLTVCFECKLYLPNLGPAYKDRTSHFMQYTNQVFTCPVCLFTLPTMCGLRAHMRFHLKYPPYYCPECGVEIQNNNVHYPFNHDCEGFKMMRATARLKCPVSQCNLFHPNDLKNHMKETHIKKVFKCPICVVACFNRPTMQKHLLAHCTSNTNNDIKATIFYQCELCPGRLVLQYHIENHLHTHLNSIVFPCWNCGMIFKEAFALIDHCVKKHNTANDVVKKMFTAIVHESENQQGKPKRIYRVVKRCDQCKRNFTYKCKYNEIPVLPNECPYKCTSKLKTNCASDDTNRQITCTMCKITMSSDWNEIKKHYSVSHKNHRCLDLKINLERIDVKDYLIDGRKKIKRGKIKRHLPEQKSKDNETETQIRSSPVTGHCCGLCGETCDTKELLETHMISHKDPCMAYQCMECGQSFVVKPSFSKHLLLEHGITDVEEYISNKQCFNENALEKHQNDSSEPTEPIRDNQCTICRDQFDNSEDLEKHFRVHGMAFLLKTSTKNS